MQKIKLIILTVVLFKLFFSCHLNDNCTKLYINKDEKEWFKHNIGNELILFKDSKGNIDTFQIEKVDDFFTDCNKFELGEFQYNTISMALFKKKKKKKEMVFKMIFSKELQNKSMTSCYKNFEFYNLTVEYITNMDTFKVEPVRYLNKVVDSYCVDFKINATSNWWGTRKIEFFNITKKYGLIRYKYLNGETYHFWKKLKI